MNGNENNNQGALMPSVIDTGGNRIALDTRPELRPAPGRTLPALAGPTTALIQSLDDVIRVANLYAVAAGKGWQNDEGRANFAVRLLAGLDLGLPATMAVGNVMVVNGAATIWGDLPLALVRASGLLEYITEEEYGEGDAYTWRCTVKRKGCPQPRVSTFSWAEAVRAKLTEKAGPWQTHPRRQMMFRARQFALRDEFGDVLKGMEIEESQPPEIIPGFATAAAPPAAQIAAPPAAKSIAAPQPEDVPDSAPMTPAMFERIKRERAAAEAHQNLQPGSDAAKAFWQSCLKKFGVDSVKGLNQGTAKAFLEHLKSVATSLFDQAGGADAADNGGTAGNGDNGQPA